MFLPFKLGPEPTVFVFQPSHFRQQLPVFLA
jgi:hypothetical protein